MHELGFDQRLQYSTCRIEATYESGAVGCGTAFYYGYRIDEERFVPMIVTNRHVIFDPIHGAAKGGRFQVHAGQQTERGVVPSGFRNVEFDPSSAAFHEFWIGHSDPNVDLCAMMAAPLTLTMKGLGTLPFISVVGDAMELDQQGLDALDVVEDVVMVGYPTGLWDDAHNFPLFRKGTTATHAAVDFQNRPEFVVDLACFPGSSGSPVFCWRKDGYPGEERPGDPRRLLGVLHAGPVMPGNGAMINLGYVIKAEKVRELAAQVWTYWDELGYILLPWSNDFENSLLPDGTQVPDEQGEYHLL